MNVEMWDNFDAVEEAVDEGVKSGLYKAASAELEDAEEAYDAEQTVLGQPWKPLSPVTIANKGHDTILVEEGDMRDSGFVSREDGMRVNVGFSDWKVPIHEWGTEDIPARPIVEPMRVDLAENRLTETVADSVDESLDNVGVRRL